MKTKFFALAAAAALVSVFAIGAVAQETPAEQTKEGRKFEKREGKKHGFGGDRKGRMGGKFKRGGHGLHGIELTEAQKVQIKAIRDANRPDPAVREEMRGLMKAKFDGTITTEQTARLDSIRRTQLDNAVNVRTQIENVLTVEQKAQLEARKAERKAKMEQHRKMREERKAQKPTDN